MGLPYDRQRTIKNNKLTEKTKASTRCIHNLSDDSTACSLESFFFSIHYRMIANKSTRRRRWRNGSRALSTTTTCMLSLGTRTTSAIMGISHLGAASRLRDSGAILVVLEPLLLATRGTTTVHGC